MTESTPEVANRDAKKDIGTLESLKIVCDMLDSGGISMSELARAAKLPYATVKQLLTRTPDKPRLNNNFRKLAAASISIAQSSDKKFRALLEVNPNRSAAFDSLLEFVGNFTNSEVINSISSLVCENFRNSALLADVITLSERYYVLRKFDDDRVCAINIVNVAQENGAYIFYQTLVGRNHNNFSYGRILSGLGTISLVCDMYGLVRQTDFVSAEKLRDCVLEDNSDYIVTNNAIGLEFYSFSRFALSRPKFFAAQAGVNARGDPTFGELLFVDASTRSPISDLIAGWLKEDFGDIEAPHGIVIGCDLDKISKMGKRWPVDGKQIEFSTLTERDKGRLTGRWQRLRDTCHEKNFDRIRTNNVLD
jgi:hypothetical protein